MNCIGSSKALQQRTGAVHRLARLPPSARVFGGFGRVSGRSIACGATESKEAPASTQPDAVPSASASAPAVPLTLAQRALANAPEWPAFLGTLANSGFITGTLLDGIHSRMGLQVYDWTPLVLGGLKTSAAVPPLLALFYVVLGSLVPIADNLSPSPETDSIRQRCNETFYVAAAFGVLAGLLQLSATLYDSNVPYWQIHAILGTAALVNWKLFDGTRQGIALALLCGVGAPLAEVVLLQLVPLWHYPRADLGGVFVSWVFWCYFFYTPALGALARYLWSTMKELEQYKRSQAVAAAGQQQQQPPPPQ
ncbi:hypothetical protein HYH02_001456 [Chlamydomonas schloesseri]|uniref:Uncharacterized protein n=1 Tax=Chlamydomonas schloesseri TaxID=2026947 RepID=A0A835WUV2_9CHLO|nr:hypothetical protein HYH02_001456 [Chlamydomonas schloesseri]|eukprot:KAG2454437.1 hypothetical protein HYH02_001456 [Chlamydomonas schloesseri]